MLRSRESGGRRGGKGVRYEIVDRRRVSGPKPLACLSHLVARYREGTEACPRTSCSRLLPLDEREKGKGLRQKPARDFFFSLSLRSHRRRRVRGLTWRTVPVFLGVVFLAAAFFLPPPKIMEVAFFLVIILFIALRCVSVVDLRSFCRGCPRHGSPKPAHPIGDVARSRTPWRITKDFYSTPEPNLIPRAGDEKWKILMNSQNLEETACRSGRS